MRRDAAVHVHAGGVPDSREIVLCALRPPLAATRLTPLAWPPAVSAGVSAATIGLRLDIAYSFTDRSDVLRIFIGDGHIEGFFEFHHQLHDVQGISPEVVDEAALRSHRVGADIEPLNNNLYYLCIDIRHCISLQKKPAG